MLTTDKIICSADYWNDLYAGNRTDAKVDSSNGVRPAASFDRFDIVVKHAEGPNILGVGSGHARIEQRIKALHPGWFVVASDQSIEAQKVSGYDPYLICSAYKLPLSKTYKWDTVICTQALEYMELPDAFLSEAKRVSKKFLCTVPLGEMSNWSQLRIYTEDNFMAFLIKYGNVEAFEKHENLLLGKIRFYE